MKMINPKSCPRCGGDQLVEEYLGDTELVCLQCGRRTDVPGQVSYFERLHPSARRKAPKERVTA